MWFPLVDLFETHVDTIKNDELRMDIRGIIAQTHMEKLDDLESAQGHFEQMLTEQGEHREAIDSLDSIYRATEQWNPLIEILRTQILLAEEDEEKMDLLFQSESIWSHNLNQIDEAMGAVQEILGIKPDCEEDHARLDGLYTQAENWEELAHTLETRVQLSGDLEDEIELMARLATVREAALKDIPGAV